MTELDPGARAQRLSRGARRARPRRGGSSGSRRAAGDDRLLLGRAASRQGRPRLRGRGDGVRDRRPRTAARHGSELVRRLHRAGRSPSGQDHTPSARCAVPATTRRERSLRGTSSSGARLRVRRGRPDRGLARERAREDLIAPTARFGARAARRPADADDGRVGRRGRGAREARFRGRALPRRVLAGAFTRRGT